MLAFFRDSRGDGALQEVRAIQNVTELINWVSFGLLFGYVVG